MNHYFTSEVFNCIDFNKWEYAINIYFRNYEGCLDVPNFVLHKRTHKLYKKFDLFNKKVAVSELK
jgi:hypothetical protein